MAKRRRKAKNKREQKAAKDSKKFVYTLVGLALLFVVGFVVLRLAL